MQNPPVYDVLIIGSGAAGLGLALSLTQHGRIALISKNDLQAGSSQKAQGGIAAVMSEQDSHESHIEDTLVAGAGLCNKNTVEFIVKNAKPAIEWLMARGVKFTTENEKDSLHLTQEGGHSHRRILHVADKTGAAVIETLSEQVLHHPQIDCLIEHTAIDLIVADQQCYGAVILDNQKGNYISLFAKVTVIATGGASGAYQHTSNPEDTLGDGITMAKRAGCRIANLEFNQFHPTCLYHPNSKPFLITEAVRGEGGKLVLANGESFMHRYDARGELAPRDIVARAIDAELKKHRIPCVYLDIRHKTSDFIIQHFPTIYEYCLTLGIDITRDLIPVVPAAHYTCGGVITDLNGQTDISHLYAMGEVACTGMHGANRMASNSLLECLVIAMNSSKIISEEIQRTSFSFKSEIPHPQGINPQKINIRQVTQELKQIMSDEVGIVRTNHRLHEAQKKVFALAKQLENSYSSEIILSKEAIELKNLALLCHLIISCALARKESRGLHYNLDYPETFSEAKDNIIFSSITRHADA